MDSNGYNTSLFSTEQGHCYLCNRVEDTARHEVFFGTGNRKLSKRYGTWVNLCPSCHSMVHSDRTYDLMLKRQAQMLFSRKYDHKKYMELFGKNYLD